MRPNQPEIALSFLAATAVALAGLSTGGCAPDEEVVAPVEGGAEPSGAADAQTGPLITPLRSFHGDPLFEWVSGSTGATFHRYEPAAFQLSGLGEANRPRTVTVRIDGQRLMTRSVAAHDGQPVHVPVDTAVMGTGTHEIEVRVEAPDGAVETASLEFEVLFNVTAVATDPLFGGVLAGTVEAGAYWFPKGAEGPPRHLPAAPLDQGWSANARFAGYPAVDGAAVTSGMSILRAKYDAELGGFWMGTLFQGLTLFLPGADAASDRFVHVHVPNGDLPGMDPERLEPESDEDWAALHGLSSRDSVVDLLPDADGLWIATFHGLVRWDHGGTPADPGDDRWHVAIPPDPHLAAVARDDDGRLWVGTWDFEPEGEPALFTYDPDTDEFTPVDVEADRILALAVDRSGAVWAGSDNGLYRFAGDEVRRFGAADGLRDQDVLAILPERDGPGVWFGAVDICGGDGGGLHRLRPDEDDVLVLTRADGLGDDDVTSLAHGSDGGLWAGTFNLLGAANIANLWELDVPECRSAEDEEPPATRIGRDGLSRITQAAPWRFEIDNL